MVFWQQSLLWGLPFLGDFFRWLSQWNMDEPMSRRHWCRNIFMQKYIHYLCWGPLPSLMARVVMETWAFFPPLAVFLLFSRSGYERLNALQISLMNGVQQFSLPPVGLLFTFMKQTDTEHDSVALMSNFIFNLLSYLQKQLCLRGVQERVGDLSLQGNMLVYDAF